VTFVESIPYFPAATSLGDPTLKLDVAFIPLPVPSLSESTSPPQFLPPRSLAPLEAHTCQTRPLAPAPPPSSLPSSNPVSPPVSEPLLIALQKGKHSCTT